MHWSGRGSWKHSVVLGGALLSSLAACSSEVGADGQTSGGAVGGGDPFGTSSASGATSGELGADGGVLDPSGASNSGSGGDGAGGASSAGDPPTPEVADCGERTLPTQPLRRLAAHEYENTLRDLFGGDLGRRVTQDSSFPPTLLSTGFSTNAEANTVNTAESNAIEDNAERIATLIDGDPEPFLRGLLPCSLPDPITDAAIDDCVDDFIADFGQRAYRRPLTDSESELARGVYDAVRETGEARFAWSGLVQYFVQAPALLYRVERGAPVAEQFLVPLSDWERATRLSYLLRGSMPDAALIDAAAAGELRTAEQVRAHAERLLDEEGFFPVVERFHREWLELHGYEWKPPEQFPAFDAARGSLDREQGELLRAVIRDGDGRIATLLGSQTFPLNATLAAYYGVEGGGATDDEWAPVDLPNRRGLLTQASLMATLATSTETSVIHRGAFFQTQVLCRSLPSLPGNVDIQTPLEDTSDLPTARERLSPLMERGDCLGCHSLINPVGLAFENYDASGQWRTQENGTDIDASGTMFLDDAEVSFADAIELIEAVASSREARDCYATQWFRMGLGRAEFAEDDCSLDSLIAATAAADGDVREMILALVQTDAFLFKLPVEEEVEP